MKCKKCESEKVVGLKEYADNSSRTLVTLEALCSECGETFYESGLIPFSKAGATTERIFEADDINYISGCIEQNIHTIYNDSGKPVKVKL